MDDSAATKEQEDAADGRSVKTLSFSLVNDGHDLAAEGWTEIKGVEDSNGSLIRMSAELG